MDGVHRRRLVLLPQTEEGEDMADDEVDERVLREETVSDHEARSLLGVQTRLLGRFPRLGSAVVNQAVEAAYRTMNGPIRDFVPLLVEHDARDILQDIAHPRLAVA